MMDRIGSRADGMAVGADGLDILLDPAIFENDGVYSFMLKTAGHGSSLSIRSREKGTPARLTLYVR
jgi:hypothetical protein